MNTKNVQTAIAELMELQDHYQFNENIKNQFTLLIERIEKHTSKQSCYAHIHKLEHDRLIAKHDAEVEDLINNFEEIFKHDYEGEYEDDIEFKEEIKEHYLEEIAYTLISDYKILLDDEELFY